MKPAPESESRPSVGVVIVNHNLKDTLRATLESFLAVDYPAFSIVVCDNGSSDGSPEMIRRSFPQVHCIANPVGLGYARAASQGMAHLAPDHEYLFSISNDVTVDPAIFRELVQAAEAHPRAAILGSKVYFHDRPDILWHAGGRVHPWHGHTYHYGWERRDHPRYNRIRACDYVTGCGYLVRSEVARQLGYLKDDLVFYFEDADFCYRARAAGWEVLYVPTARVWHKTSTTLAKDRGLQLRYATRNNLYLLARHRVGPWFPFCLAVHLAAVLPCKMALFLALGRWKNTRGIWRGFRDWHRGQYGMIRE